MAPPKSYNVNELTCELLPKLITALTGFEDGDENKTRCEHFAWSSIRNHRYLSTNSHDVRRRIKGMHEKFRVDNQADYADYFERLCQQFAEHPHCIAHDEVDVQWSVLDFLLTLAYNPTGALRRNQHKISIMPLDDAEAEEDEQQSIETELEDIKNELKAVCIPLPDHSDHDDSELSDWSESEEVPKSQTSPIADTRDDDDSQNKSPIDKANFQKYFPGIKPPEKAPHYYVIDNEKSTENLLNTVQHSWWLSHAEPQQVAVRSTKMEANFAVLYHKFLEEKSNNLLRREPPTTVPEYCLLREVLWMFHAPQQCKFFDVAASGLIVRDNVTIPSLTAHGLSCYLDQRFIPYMQMMHTLRQFYDTIHNCDDFVTPKTVEFYSDNLHLLLQPFRRVILDYEHRLMQQRFADICTLMQLELELREPLIVLKSLYNIHQQCMMNVRQSPPHISSAYLLTSLLHCNTIAGNALETNLAISLFITAVKPFCTIIDTWWTQGRLEDWQHEFLVQCNSDHSVELRLYRKDKQEAFFVPTHVAKVIADSRFFNLLLEHTLEAGYTLNLLYEINRISDLKTTCAAIEGKLYNVFVDDVLMQVKTFQKQLSGSCDVGEATEEAVDTSNAVAVQTVDVCDPANSDETDTRTENNESTCDSNTTHATKRLDTIFSTTDVFLLSLFKLDIGDDEPDAIETDQHDAAYDALHIFEQFEQSKGVILPLEEIILNSLSRILRTRIASANSFVVELYSNEFAILTHLGNIRKVLLLEASDIMHQFYSKLFKQIESGREWAFPFILTMQLDDVICTKYSSMASLFRLEINSTFRCKTDKVFEAVDELTITYNLGRELCYVITAADLDDYNRVFRLLLKVKWCLMTLESLQFPQVHKRRNPYTPFEMIDLLMRRLEQLRFWMMYAMQSIHFHLMAHVLQPMGAQLDEKILRCRNLKEMQAMHKSYIHTICAECFLLDDLSAIKLGVEQLLNLTYVLRMEWHGCMHFIDSNSPLASESSISDRSSDMDNCVLNSQIDAIELTYIRCHQYLANKLNNEVYLRRKTFLSGLSDAFNTSLPH